MLTKTNFSETEWINLRDTPQLVGAAVMFAGASGLGTIKESVTLAQKVLAGQASDLPLIRDLSNQAEIQAAQGALREIAGNLQPGTAQDELRRISFERVRGALALLSKKGTPEELKAFRDWVWNIGEGVARAAKEGGFFGFGGTEVSSGEQSYLAELKTALQT